MDLKKINLSVHLKKINLIPEFGKKFTKLSKPQMF
jgi:hypothetical protein